MAVGTQKGVSGNAKSLQVNLMRNPIARPRENHSVFCCKGPEKSVVVAVLKPILKRIVVHITDRQLSGNGGYVKRLKLEARHRAGSILSQGLVNREF
jgi:ribosomal protein L17